MNNKRTKAHKMFRTMPSTGKYTISDAYKRPTIKKNGRAKQI